MDPMGYNDQATDTTSASQGFNECTRVLSKQKKHDVGWWMRATNMFQSEREIHVLCWEYSKLVCKYNCWTHTYIYICICWGIRIFTHFWLNISGNQPASQPWTSCLCTLGPKNKPQTHCRHCFKEVGMCGKEVSIKVSMIKIHHFHNIHQKYPEIANNNPSPDLPSLSRWPLSCLDGMSMVRIPHSNGPNSWNSVGNISE